MKKLFSKHWVTLRILLVTSLCVMASLPVAPEVGARSIPGLLDFSKLKIEIVAANFVTEYGGITSRYTTDKPEEHRGLVLTLRISKPADTPVKLHVADIALHYYYGNKYDVAPCKGVSSFSTELKTDRPMKFSKVGFGSTSTGIFSMQAGVVYVDLFFRSMEPNTGNLYLLIAQPVGISFKTEGYKK